MIKFIIGFLVLVQFALIVRAEMNGDTLKAIYEMLWFMFFAYLFIEGNKENE